VVQLTLFAKQVSRYWYSTLAPSWDVQKKKPCEERS
jgi:hypothetical protein